LFFQEKNELVGNMEQPEYTETPVGLARKPETLQAKGRSGSARAPRKAECIQAAGDNN